MDLSGILVPLTTPFDPVTGEADLVGLRRNARAILAAPVAGLVLFGSTGEGLLLDPEERSRLVEGVREMAGERPLLVGTGAESTRATIRLTRQAAEAGADAVLVQPPAYYRPQMTPDALVDHFRAVADASPVPVILYQVPPAYSGVEVPAGLAAELSRHPRIVGIKDSSGELRTLGELVETSRKGFAVLVGNGSVLYAGLEIGARGGVLAVANLAPRETTELYRLQRAGDGVGAGRLQERIAPLHRAVVARFGVPGIKAALDMLGLSGGAPRSPLKPLREKERRVVREALESARLLGAARAPSD